MSNENYLLNLYRKVRELTLTDNIKLSKMKTEVKKVSSIILKIFKNNQEYHFGWGNKMSKDCINTHNNDKILDSINKIKVIDYVKNFPNKF